MGVDGKVDAAKTGAKQQLWYGNAVVRTALRAAPGCWGLHTNWLARAKPLGERALPACHCKASDLTNDVT